MARILRSKPVLIIGSGAALRQIVKKAKARRKRRSVAPKVAGLAFAGAAGGAVKYFADSTKGSGRRRKLARIVKKGASDEDYNSTPGATFSMQDSTPAEL